MAWIRPTLGEIVDRIIRDMESRLTGLVALLKVSVLIILAKMFGGAVHILYGYIKNLMDEYLPDKSKELLSRHGYIWGVPRKSPSFATGNVVFTGINATSIEQDLQIQRGDGILYITKVAGVIANGFLLLAIEAIEAGVNGNILDGEELSLIEAKAGVDDVVHTAIWSLPYDNLLVGFFETGDTIVNGTQSGEALVVVGDTGGAFVIQVVILSGTFEDDDSISCGSVTADVNGNISNISEISGGVDEESDEDWRSRILQRIQTPPSGGSKDDIERWAGEVEGVDKGWCFSTTPSPGWVTVVIKALGTNIIPSATLLTSVYDYLMARVSVTTNLIVIAIDPVDIDLWISINPNTAAFQTKIETNVDQLFAEPTLTIPGEDVLLSNLRDAIKKSGITDYALTAIDVDGTPVSITTDINLTGYQYPTLGSITYATL